jgi:hypothetical protein
MIELKSREQMARAIKRARQLKPFVRVRGFRWYEVQSKNGSQTYTIHFHRDGKRRLEPVMNFEPTLQQDA